jgi:hypothetical protein
MSRRDVITATRLGGTREPPKTVSVVTLRTTRAPKTRIIERQISRLSAIVATQRPIGREPSLTIQRLNLPSPGLMSQSIALNAMSVAGFRELPWTVIAAISQTTTRPRTRIIRRQVSLRTARPVIRLSSGRAQSLTITTPNLPSPGRIAQSIAPNVTWEGDMRELRPIASPVI